MPYHDFIMKLHKKTSRNYLERVCDHDKIECATIAKQYGRDYWDGDRRYGYGGYSYDGRWEGVARDMIEHYQLTESDSILDIGCGKGFLLYEMKKLLPGIRITGVDISDYALMHCKPEIKDSLHKGEATSLPYEDRSFDYVMSLGTLHNLKIYDLEKAVREIGRVLKNPERAYIMVESYRNEAERVNLLYWQLTCESFYSVDEWEWIYHRFGYRGDYSFIFFE